MIDIHAHILPGIDDGSRNLEESLQMADIAVSSGVDTLIMTPHCNITDYYENYYRLDLMHAFRDFKRALKEAGIPLQILPGMEIFTTANLPELIKNRNVIGLNFSKYMLMEFDFGCDANWMTDQLRAVLDTGNIPVIAHPERYDAIFEEPDLAICWIKMGCLFQCNKGSFLGSFGRQAEETAHSLLNHHLVSFIASDTHRSRIRTPDMKKIYSYISRHHSEETAQLLMQENPLRLCQNKPVPTPDFIDYTAPSYWAF